MAAALPGARHCPRCDHLVYPVSYRFAWSWTRMGRGLCRPCYSQLSPDERVDYPRLNHAMDDVMEGWELLRSEGHTKRQAAARLGMSLESFDRAFHRAKAAGDPRALPAIGDEWRAKAS